MYLLMQMGSKLGCYIRLPLGITPSSVFQYIKTHIQFAHPKFQKFADLSLVQLFTLNFQDQGPWLPRASPVGSQLSAHPQVEELCGCCPLYVPLLGILGVNDVLHISNISLAASSLPAQLPLSLHAWNIS